MFTEARIKSISIKFTTKGTVLYQTLVARDVTNFVNF